MTSQPPRLVLTTRGALVICVIYTLIIAALFWVSAQPLG